MLCNLQNFFVLFGFIGLCSAFRLHGTGHSVRKPSRLHLQMQGNGLAIDMTGKTVFVAGVADSSGYGWAIAKACAEAGATILLGTWPPVLPMFAMGLERGQFEEDKKLSDGSQMEIKKIYPLDAVFDDAESVPEEVAKSKRYRGVSNYSIQEVVDKVKEEFGTIDYLVHSLANGPEVTKPLLETTRNGYLAASSSSAYSLVSMVSRFGPIMNKGKDRFLGRCDPRGPRIDLI